MGSHTRESAIAFSSISLARASGCSGACATAPRAPSAAHRPESRARIGARTWQRIASPSKTASPKPSCRSIPCAPCSRRWKVQSSTSLLKPGAANEDRDRGSGGTSAAGRYRAATSRTGPGGSDPRGGERVCAHRGARARKAPAGDGSSRTPQSARRAVGGTEGAHRRASRQRAIMVPTAASTRRRHAACERDSNWPALNSERQRRAKAIEEPGHAMSELLDLALPEGEQLEARRRSGALPGALVTKRTTNRTEEAT
jgi:hypothetical protein